MTTVTTRTGATAPSLKDFYDTDALYSPEERMIRDSVRDYMRSELYVLSYPTFAVTALDGRFDIGGIPAGKVKVTAYSPALGKVVEQAVDVAAGAAVDIAFTIDFSDREYRERLRSAPPVPTK